MDDHHLHFKYRREPPQPVSLDWPLTLKLLHYIRPYHWLGGFALFMLLLAKAVEAIVPIFIGHITQQMMASQATTWSEKQELLNIILDDCLWIIGLLAIGYILEVINVVIKSWIGQKAIFKLRSKVYLHILNMPLKFFDQHAVGRLITRAIHDIEQINQMLTESIIPLLGSMLLFMGMCIGIALIDWRIAIAFGCIVPIVIWLTNHFRYYEHYWHNVVRSIVSTMNAFAQEYFMGTSTIRTFGLQKQEKHRFDELNEDHRKANIETIHYFSFFIAGIDFLQSLSLILAFAILTITAPPGHPFQVGAFFAFSLYALMFFRPLIDVADRYNILQSAIAAAERVFRLLDQPTEPIDRSDKTPLEEVHSIAFEDVWFAYEEEKWILKGLSFEIKKGESFALVGLTGAGKTTIFSLILRFYDFQKGSIKINGKDIREYPLHILRKQFSVVLQDPVIFSGSISDNISLYQSEITPQRILAAVEYADLSLFVERFPEGVNHQIIERGQNLSGGQRQLISLARAVAHERSVFMLDEATANIDVVTEHVIQDILNKLLKEKTSLVIAHRLSTIRHVTRILVLHQGVVAESGTHQELLEQKGLYEKLYRVQFLARDVV